jgi:hypothetical protein
VRYGWPVRWGSEAQATHCREGEAGYGVYWEELQEALSGHELYQQIPVKCAEWQFALMGSTVMRQTGCRLFG